MKKFFLPVVGLFAIGAVISWAQVLPQPGPPVPIACAYNTSPPTLTNGQAGWVQCTNAGKLQVDATVNASVSGWAPNGSYAGLTATGSSDGAALPSGTDPIIFNTGTTAVSCVLGVGAQTATVSKIIVQPSSWQQVTVGSNTHVACIDNSGSASNPVVIAGGAGLANGAGGGGGSGGSVTQGTSPWIISGTTADAAVLAAIQSAIPAGTNIIGKVGIDQTTPGTTNGVYIGGVGTTAVTTAVPIIARQVNPLASQVISGTTAISASAIAAQGASTRFYMTDFSCSNIGASATEVFFLNGNSVGALPIWSTIAPAGGGSNKSFTTPVSTTANTALIISSTVATSTLRCSVSGYTGT